MTGTTFIEGLDSFEEARSMALPSASDRLLLTNELKNGSWPPLLVYVSMSLRHGLGFPRGTRIGRGEDLTLLDKINFGTAVGHPLLGLFRIPLVFLHHLVHFLRLLAEPGCIVVIPSGLGHMIIPV